MKVLVIGQGSLGLTLCERLAVRADSGESKISDVMSVGHSELDISDRVAMNRFFHSVNDLDVIVNCAAFTDTKAAEREKYDESYRVNAVGVANVMEQSLLNDARLIHVSTDYVYSENSVTEETQFADNGVPTFDDTSRPFPVNAYGLHKLIGEGHLVSGFSSCLRVGWLYGSHSGGRSFVDKILNGAKAAISNGSRSIKVVDDIYGIPTSTDFVADAIIGLIEHDLSDRGLVRCVPKGSPVSRFDFAKSIVKGSGLDVKVVPCKSAEFKTEIRYPMNTSMRNNCPLFGSLAGRSWQDALQDFLKRKFFDNGDKGE